MEMKIIFLQILIKMELDNAALRDLFSQLRKNNKNYSQDRGNNQITNFSKSQRIFTKNKS